MTQVLILVKLQDLTPYRAVPSRTKDGIDVTTGSLGDHFSAGLPPSSPEVFSKHEIGKALFLAPFRFQLSNPLSHHVRPRFDLSHHLLEPGFPAKTFKTEDEGW